MANMWSTAFCSLVSFMMLLWQHIVLMVGLLWLLVCMVLCVRLHVEVHERVRARVNIRVQGSAGV